MPTKKALIERYPHLLNEQSDAATVALVEQLDAAYKSPEPPAHLTLAAVLAQIEAEGEPAERLAPFWSFRPLPWLPRRVGTVAIVLALAVVLMAASAYAFTSLWHPGVQPPPFDQGLDQVFKQNQLVEVHVASQSIDGFTMEVQAAYADSNRVIVAYTMTRPGQNYDDPALTDASLTTAQGDHLRWEIESPLSGDAHTITFVPLTWISNPASQLALHLTVHQLDVNAGATHLTLHGSMSFSFSAPFHQARIATPDVSATVNGVTFTLVHVVVSLSTTRLFVQGTGIAAYMESTYLYSTLTVGAWQSKAAPFIVTGPVNADEIFIGLDVSLVNATGEWTLTLQALAHPPAPTVPPPTGNAWTFHFVVQ